MNDLAKRGSDSFLQQARRNNWQRYLESLPVTQTTPRSRGWDKWILTASDATQAAMMRRQLERRRRQGLLPARTVFFVVADPGGRRIGSGGATIRLLTALYGSESSTRERSDGSDLQALRNDRRPDHRVLVIHTGGDSRRLPHCSAVGKLFARIPHILPDGRASTIFDEMLINLSGIAAASPPGVLVLSGDVLLVFDHLQLSFHRHGATGVAVAAPAALGQRHGVYVPAGEHKTVQAFLHKASADELAYWNAVDANGKVQIDTGVVWLDTATAKKMSALRTEPAVAAIVDGSGHTAGINLYSDLLLPLAKSTAYQEYLDDQSDGLATPEIRQARRTIWRRMRDTPFSVERLDPAVFVHFGTSEEYWHMVAGDVTLSRLCGWSHHTASWLGASQAEPGRELVLINAKVADAGPTHTQGRDSASPALVSDCLLGELEWQGRAILSGLETNRDVQLGCDLTLHQLPVQGGYVTRVYGITDDPKLPWEDDKATYLNMPWATFMAGMQCEPADLWPHVAEADRNLWNARLFPVYAERERSLEDALQLQDYQDAPTGWLESWHDSPRISLADGFALADGEQILDDVVNIEDQVAVCLAIDAIRNERPAAQTAQSMQTPETEALRHRCRLLETWLEEQERYVRWRALSVLAATAADRGYEDKAFADLAHVIEHDVAERHSRTEQAAFVPGMEITRPVAHVEAAARIDFGGGWTDTPPYSLERESFVLNAAISLLGKLPVVAEATWLKERQIVLESRDIEESIRPRLAGDVLSYRMPADPFSLAKAALVLKGVVPEGTPPETEIEQLLRGLPGGIRLTTQTFIPRGSGLGTSSIMAGAVLACLDELAGVRSASELLFDQVLSVEQMMTTGGGWQDQVGGLVGGVKMVSSKPGLPQQLHVENMPDEVMRDLDERTFLIYTGQQRLAKDLLRSIMAKWIAREADTVQTLDALGTLARQMESALQSRDYGQFGMLVGEHWQRNRRMDAGYTNPFIDDLFDFLEPFMEGGKLAGAGGGGFAIIIAREGVSFELLDTQIRQRYAGAPVSVWPSGIADRGLVYD